MPKMRAADANHGAMTDHSIPRKPRPAEPLGPDELVAFLGTADDRALGLAYEELGDRRAREYLQRAAPHDWLVQLRLAVLESEPVKAVKLYESVLKENPYETSALVNLGALYAQAGRTAEAGHLWERALKANPAIEEAVLNLSQIRAAGEAREILQRYLQVNPVSAKAQARLAALGRQR
jgi:tetratricopeptide (TPR) repeat protein